MKAYTVVLLRPGLRTVVLHKGLKGDPGDDGPAGSMTGPAGATNNAIAVFDGTTGNVLKDSTVPVSSLATAAALTAGLALKQDAVAGMGLSEEDFTTVLAAKLAALSTATFRGAYTSLANLQAAVPAGNTGDYAHVEVAASDIVVYHWDTANAGWKEAGKLLLAGKVDKVAGYGLSEEDFTTARLALLTGAVQTTTFNAAIADLFVAAGVATNNVITDANTSRTLATTDAGVYIRLTNAGVCTITIPTDAVAGWTTNATIQFRVAGGIPVFTHPGVTVVSSPAFAGLAANDTFTLKRVGADTWDLWVG